MIETIHCRICRKVLQMALKASTPDDKPKRWTIGTKEEISDRSTCQNHQLFLESIVTHFLRKAIHPSTFTLSFIRYERYITPQVPSNRQESWEGYHYSDEDFWSQRSISISRKDIPCDPTVNAHGYGYIWSRVRHSDFIDTDLIKLWKTDCDNRHGKIHPKISPTWLVDVEKMCLVHGGGSKKSYVALNYVWGRVAMLKATSENITLLR